MQKKAMPAIRDLDFSFENSRTRISANRDSPQIKLAGLNVGPFEEGKEYETYYWVALELDKSGITRLCENEGLSVPKISKLQWTERVQTAGQISELPNDFYPKLRRFLLELKRDVAKAPEKMSEHERAKNLATDIVNSRLRKIVTFASAPAQTEQALRNLSKEERLLYEQIFRCINEWRTQILQYEEVEE
jgi:hypothetical protein